VRGDGPGVRKGLWFRGQWTARGGVRVWAFVPEGTLASHWTGKGGDTNGKV